MQIGLGGLLTAVFVTLKLTDNVDWPWLWVLSPIWISVALWTLVMIVFGLVLVKTGK